MNNARGGYGSYLQRYGCVVFTLQPDPECYISFNDGDQSIGAQSSYTVGLDETINLSSLFSPGKKSDETGKWDFVGWSTSAISPTPIVTEITTTSDQIGQTINLYGVWARDVTFITGTSRTTTIKTQQWYSGEPHAVTAPKATLPASGVGWAVVGWASDNAASAISELSASATATTSVIPEATKYYALYKRTLTINYNANGGSGTAIAASTMEQYYNSSGALSTNKIPLKANSYTAPTASSGGWTNNGWNTSAALTGIPYNAGDTYASIGATADATNTATLYADWRRDVTFVSGQDGANTRTLTQTYASGAAQNITSPQLTNIGYGWTASGWTTSTAVTAATATGATAANTAFKPSALTYYAIYNRPLTVNYNANGGSGTTAATTLSQYYNSGSGNMSTSAIKLAANAFTAPTGGGWTFKGWNERADLTGTLYTASTSYAGIDGIGVNLTSPAATTLYAKWARNVTFYSGTGATTAAVAQEYPSGKAGSIQTPQATEPAAGCGWELVGYADSTAGTSLKVLTMSSTVFTPSLQSYYARWARPVTVRYDGNGATGFTADTTGTQFYTSKGSVTAPTIYLRNSSYINPELFTFAGWNANAAATSGSAAGSSFTSFNPAVGTANTSTLLYAIWERDIDFYYSGASSSTKQTVKQYFRNGGRETGTISTPVVPKTGVGWAFLGWSAGMNADGSVLSTTAPLTETVYYAVFKRTLTVNYNANGGSGSTVASKKDQYYNSYGVLSDYAVTLASSNFTAPTGREFGSWGTTASGGTSYAPGATYRGIGATAAGTNTATVYAQYKSINRAPTITRQPQDEAHDYGTEATLSVQATGVSGSTLRYSWEASTNSSTWTAIPEATDASYTVPVTTPANTYFYRCVVTSVVSGTADVSAISNAARVTVNRALPTFSGTLAGGEPLARVNTVVLGISSGSRELATGLALSVDPAVGLTLATSDETKVIPTLVDGTLSVRPIGTTGAVTPVRVTVTAPETANYAGCEYVFNVYVSSGPLVTVSYEPEADTQGNVTAKVLVTDPYTELDSSHRIDSVTIAGVSVAGTGTYEYVFTDNADNVPYVATDTFGGSTQGMLTVDWIDREAPLISLSVLQSTETSAFMQVIGYDNRTRSSELEYCWDYTGTAADVWRKDVTVKAYALKADVKVAVRDKAGNVTTESAVAGKTSLSDIADDIATRTQKLLRSVSAGDISGYVFGTERYIDANNTTHRYAEAPVVIEVAIEPPVDKYYIEGYLTIDGQHIQMDWYSDAGYSVTTGIVSSDGKAVSMARGKSYGRIALEPALFVKRTVRNATAVLHLITYSDTDRQERITSEQYTMTYSVDLTPPSIAATYNAYTKNLSLRASDSIAGVEDNSITVVLGSGSPQQVDANYSTTFPSSGTEPFTVTAAAKDRLGNTATLSKSYTPASGSTDGHGAGTSGVFQQGDGSSELNTAFSRSRLFNKYLVNGTHSNSDISAVPGN